ncbi:hypothetical protein HID58_023555 [Brassica napus]|uniref:Uncharacterized protein n=2 Tax=Brassica napus TaxID=3708 RepID=A0ABQ8D2E2_BRANA|nr:hypothetical protein HID58_023555 [Brassica napus]
MAILTRRSNGGERELHGGGVTVPLCTLCFPRNGAGGLRHFSRERMFRRITYGECPETASGNASYAKRLLKKLITEVELEKSEVLDEVYEEYALHMSAASKEDALVKENIRITKFISFLYPEGLYNIPSCPSSRKLIVPLQCSLNMLEGDTGCSIWPSSLFLSEFVLSYPELFTDKSCFEVGSGVGLVGICLAHVKAKKVILTDGDLLTLSNMKLNLERNHLNYEDELLKQHGEAESTRVKCIHLPWETATDSELSEHRPDIVLGADVIYDPSCFPNLLRVLVALLRGPTKRDNGSLETERRSPAVAYIASVIRNADTFNAFLTLVDQMDLSITDLTEELKPPYELLPYMHSVIIERLISKQYSVMEVIHAWSAPRSLSTSLMYSFAQRDDTEVLDEPLYAAYLKSTGADRPYRDELLSKMEFDGEKVVKDIIYGPGNKKYRFCKHISKQRLLGLPSELMSEGKHFILIRNPLNILPSFEKVHPLSFAELGLGELVSIYSDLCQMGTPPAIVDADELQQDPEGTLRGLCNDLEIPFQASMLKWEAGPIPEDGLWASWWYKTVHKSTGFSSPSNYPHTFPLKHYDLLEQCLPLYNILRRHVKHKSSLLTSTLTPPSLPVPENAKLFAWVGDEIVPREMAKVSVFDSVVQGGDSVWEGLRIYKGKVFKLEEHLDRMFDSAKALAFNNVPTREEVKEAIFRTLITNGMFDNTHIRLSLTRGKKVTSGMSPAFNRYGCTLIVLAEWKPPVYDNDGGIVLVTATTRRNSPNNLDSKIHHNNLLNNILAKIESNNANVDDAIMLDKDGFVSETNATNIFMVKKGRVLTPRADYCLPGITRATVMELVVKEDFILEERNISLSEFHTADEVWTTGTMGELSPVVKIDGRVIGEGKVGPVTRRLQNAYKKLTDDSGVPIPTYQKNLNTSCV